MENLIREDLQKGFKLYVDDLRFSDADDLKVYLDFVESAIDEWNIFKLNYLLQFTDADISVSFYKVIRNLNDYERRMKFGFYDIVLNEYGWLDKVEWVEKEEIIFKDKKSSISNKVKVGQGMNGNWTYALSYGSPYSGGGWAICVFGKIFKTKEGAIIAGLKNLIKRLEAIENKKRGGIESILAQSKDKLAQLIKIDENKQLALF